MSTSPKPRSSRKTPAKARETPAIVQGTTTKAGLGKLLNSKAKLISGQGADSEERGEEEFRHQVHCRRRLVDELRRRELAAQGARRIFISYSGSGSTVVSELRKYFEAKRFEVVLGFGTEVQTSDQYIVAKIIQLIASSSCFLGVWTKTYTCTTVPYTTLNNNQAAVSSGSAPSVWMPFELGIAMGFRKPAKVMFEAGMQNDFIEKPNMGDAKIEFVDATWKGAADKAHVYFERQLKHQHTRWTSPITNSDDE